MKNVDLLRSIGILSQMSEEDLEMIAGLLRERIVPRDTVIFQQGEPGDSLYIVQSGRVKSSTTDPVGRERVGGFFTEGQAFGETSLLAIEQRATTVQAVTDCRLLVLRKEDFDAFQAENVHVMLQMMKLAADRQAASTPRMPRIEETVGLPGMGGGKVFTVFSPKGGVGKSTIAVNLAVALAHQHKEAVALVDLSLTFGHDLLLLNLSPSSSLAATSADALRKMGLAEGLGYYLVTHERSSLRVMVGSTRPEEGEAVSGETARAAIEQLRKYFSYVVVDTACAFSDPILAALESSDRVLMVCSPEITVLHDLRECQRILNDVIHLPREKVLHLMNYLFQSKGLSKSQFEDALKQPLYMELPNGGDVPMKASLRGEAFVETQSGSSISKAIQKLATQLVAETASRSGASSEKKRGLFGR